MHQMRCARYHLHPYVTGFTFLKLFVGIELGVLRAALATDFITRCYTSVDKDPISRRVASFVLWGLQRQFPLQLPSSTIMGFDTHLPHNIAHCSPTFLAGLLAHRGPVGLLGASWECQRISKAGRRHIISDTRFKYFFNVVPFINFSSKSSNAPYLHSGEYVLGSILHRSRANRLHPCAKLLAPLPNHELRLPAPSALAVHSMPT